MCPINGEEKDGKDFEELEEDPTRKAFFADMGDIEQEIVAEAYDLVEHAVSLIESRFFDDAIEILRQAIGLYDQIGRQAEINAVNDKISEIYLFKEQAFKEEVVSSSEVEGEDEKVSISEEVSEPTSSTVFTDQLLDEAIQLVEIDEFEEALERYDEIIRIYESEKNKEGINQVNKLIKDCYNKKRTSLEESYETEEVEIAIQTREEKEQAERLQAFEAQKLEQQEFEKEIEEIVNRAEKSAREYELAIRKGKFEVLCPYQNIIAEYKKVKKMLKEKDWLTQIPIYARQVKIYEEKLERDKRLRALEEEKKQKQAEYEASLKASKKDMKEIKKYQKIVEEKEEAIELEKFEAEIDKMVNNAEKLAREYEIKIKKGKFEQECVYPEVIEIYDKIIEKVSEKGWQDEAAIYRTQIRKYKNLLEKDKRLRKIEEQKEIKKKEYEELYFKKKEESSSEPVEIDNQLSQKEEEVTIRSEIEKMERNAERLAREYEYKIKKGKFEQECVYLEVIEIYDKIIEIVTEKGWDTEITIYRSQVRKYKELLEKDKRIREIEEQKLLKQKYYEELYKGPKATTSIDKDKLKNLEAQKEKDIEEQKIRAHIEKMIKDAERKAREYDLKIRKGKFEQKCVYPEIIEIFEKIIQIVSNEGWTDEAAIYRTHIRKYKELNEKDIKIRELEAQKVEKQKVFKQAKKIDRKADPLKMQEVEEAEIAKKANEEKVDQAFKLIDKAEKLVKNYELKLKKEILEFESPYEKVIKLYKEARKLFQDGGWKHEASKLIATIKLYKDKKESDEKLREVEKQKLEKVKEFKEMQKLKPTIDYNAQKRKLKEIVKKRKKEDKKTEEIFTIINEAEKIAKDYGLTLKSGVDILELECPYERVINIYRDARKRFEEIGWKDEANKLINSIRYYEEKLEKDNRLRKIEKDKVEKEEKFKAAIAVKQTEGILLGEKKRLKLDKEKEKRKRTSDEAFEIIDEAEKLAKDYEISIRGGNILEFRAPFERVIQLYREARKKFKESGWTEQANNLIETINFYKEKKEADNNLREIEKSKIEKSKIELEQLQKIRKEIKIEETKSMKEKREALMRAKKVESQYETIKNKAFNLMDRAKHEFTQNNFNKAIELYKQSEKIFNKIDWKDGLKMIRESITMIKQKQKIFADRLKAIEEKKVKQEELEKKLEEKLSKVLGKQKEEREQKRLELLKAQKEKEKEKLVSEEAYSLLEKGTILANKQKFQEAYDSYIAARNKFREIGWTHEVSRINNDLLFNLKREEKKAAKLKALKEKKLKEKQDLEELVQSAEKKRQKIEQHKVTVQREKIAENKLSQKIHTEWDKAKQFLENNQFNQGIIALKEVKKMMEKVQWKTELNMVNSQMEKAKTSSIVPIITEEDLPKNENREVFTLAYKALDRAQVSIAKNNYMKAISELNEVKHNLHDTKIGKKYINEIDKIINKFRSELKKKRASSSAEALKEEIREPEKIEIKSDTAYDFMDKANKEERRNNFDKAIKFAEVARDIFNKLGPEWGRELAAINQHIAMLRNKRDSRRKLFETAQKEREKEQEELMKIQQEEEELKAKIAARREERRKRIAELRKKRHKE
ncbi:MAG: hypothetical protein ACTSR8_03225 [Promethearchaeota archaeon]